MSLTIWNIPMPLHSIEPAAWYCFADTILEASVFSAENKEDQANYAFAVKVAEALAIEPRLLLRNYFDLWTPRHQLPFYPVARNWRKPTAETLLNLDTLGFTILDFPNLDTRDPRTALRYFHVLAGVYP